MRYGARVVIAFLMFGSGLQAGWAQSADKQAAPGPVIHSRSTLVLIPALVRTRSGNLIYGLTTDDFTLTDDGVPQKVVLERDTGGQPLSLVILLELGETGARIFDRLGPLAPMIDSIIGAVPHRVAVVAFDSKATLQQGFTANDEAVRSAIQELAPGCTRQQHQDNCGAPRSIHDIALGDNGAAILDSVGFGVDLLRKEPANYRRALLLISETQDRGSRLTLEEALRAGSETNTIIYSIGFATGKTQARSYASQELPSAPSVPGGSWLSLENRRANPAGGCMGRKSDTEASHNKVSESFDCLAQFAPPLTLAKMAGLLAADGLSRNSPETLAHLTGGEYFKLTDAKSLERDLGVIANHVPNRYVLGFQPTSPHLGFHTLNLQLRDASKVEVLARSGYWATP